MASSGMLRRVAIARTDVSEELRASFIRVTRIGVSSKRGRLLVTAGVVPTVGKTGETAVLGTSGNRWEDSIQDGSLFIAVLRKRRAKY
jgi:hypothetical protein